MHNLLKTILGACLLLVPARSFSADTPRPEYPRPQFAREQWTNLNGTWTYQFDFGNSGTQSGLSQSHGFASTITVPFCPESSLSGVGHKDFINAMWYHRTLQVPAAWRGKHVILHFGGVDYRSQIYIDGKLVKEHFGGSASFEADITRFVNFGGENHLVVYVQDDVRAHVQPSGKQSPQFNSYGCMYTRVTGIWQTVWMEPVVKGGLRSCRITPDLDNQQFLFEPVFYEIEDGARLTVTLKDGSKVVARREVLASNSAVVILPVKKVKTWSPESPFLYGVEYTLKDARGNTIDHVESYAGMRKTEVKNGQYYLNNKHYVMRLVLDQGFYPDGIWTAPSDEALRHDIEMSKAVGFNGARLHQKVFEERYYYWADKLGYLTWGEFPSWGPDINNPASARNLLEEWAECVSRDYSKPSLVAWSPLNEIWQEDKDGQRIRTTNDLYNCTHRLDRTRPVVTTSGGYHTGLTDIYAEHCYEQDPMKFLKLMSLTPEGKAYNQHPGQSTDWEGQPYIIDEYGGIGWFKPDGKTQAWGYGNGPKTLEEYYERLEGLTSVLLSQEHIIGFCYTQITDVEQERNGIYTYQRKPKFDAARLKSIFGKSRADAKQYVQEHLKGGATE